MRASALITLLALACSGCTYRYRIEITGIITSEGGKPLQDVKVSVGRDEPGMTIKWSGPDGSFTKLTLQLADGEFRDGQLPSRFLWLSRDGYEDFKIDVSPKQKPKSYSDVQKLHLKVRLKAKQ